MCVPRITWGILRLLDQPLLNWKLEIVSNLDPLLDFCPPCLLVGLLLYLFPVSYILDCRLTCRGQSRISTPLFRDLPFCKSYEDTSVDKVLFF